MLQKYHLKLLEKIALLIAVMVGAAATSSWVSGWPVRLGPKLAPGSIAASRPSGSLPDNIVLVPAGDLSSSLSVTWRTSDGIADGVVLYRMSGETQDEEKEARAALTALSSPELMGDNTVHCFSATLVGLTPGATYSYRVGSRVQNIWSDYAAFTTAEKTPEAFTFVYMADTQTHPDRVGNLLKTMETRHPETAFFMNSGDIVDEGELRNLWDDFLANTQDVFSRKPFAPAMGNHDPGEHNDGSAIFNAYFNTPNRSSEAPKLVENYSFRYGAANFIVINQFDVSNQTEWLEDELQTAEANGAEFQIVMFHHPVYNPNRHRSNSSAQAEWVPLFDRYKVDLVLTGHDHSYARSRPLKAGKAVPAGEFGTTYIVSTACDKFYSYETLDTAAIQFADAATCQAITLAVNGGRGAEVRYRAYSSAGNVVDEFAYTKQQGKDSP